MGNRITKFTIAMFLGVIIMCVMSDKTEGGVMDKNNHQEENPQYVNFELIQEKFEDLYNQWQNYMKEPKVKISSRSQDYISCAPYRDIINLGRPVLPFLIQKMHRGKVSAWNEGQFLLWYAVREISGVNLIKDDEVISEQEIAERYINWYTGTLPKVRPLK